eukprot:3697156-Rhodomonas_salina.1
MKNHGTHVKPHCRTYAAGTTIRLGQYRAFRSARVGRQLPGTAGGLWRLRCVAATCIDAWNRSSLSQYRTSHTTYGAHN